MYDFFSYYSMCKKLRELSASPWLWQDIKVQLVTQESQTVAADRFITVKLSEINFTQELYPKTLEIKFPETEQNVLSTIKLKFFGQPTSILMLPIKFTLYSKR